MAVTVRKYNPGFLTDDELVESFCVRAAEFDSIVESLSDGSGGPSPHTIVIGPRGSGKTHLLLRVAAEMRRSDGFEGYFPIVFAEESYEVSSYGEFWLECLGRLAEQASVEERSSLRLTYEDLRAVADDGVLAERCLGALLDFSDKHRKRLAMIVENLNMLLPDIADPDAGWKLRSVLQTEPRITLLGSATSRFEEIDHPDQPLYDIFRAVTLRSLSTEECAVLWSTVSGQPGELGTIRPLQILTGGSPRMIAVVAGFKTTQSFNELMNNLLELIDDHTEYFKSHIDALPSHERRVYLALARLWKPATTREVADQARIDTSRCSAFLKRLIERGAVTEEGGTPRRRQYYLTERLYNIYYLLRRPSGEGQVVRALIQFMVCCYSSSELLRFGRHIAQEYENNDGQLKMLHELAFQDLLNLPEIADMRAELLTDSDVVSSFGSTATPEIAEAIATELAMRAQALAEEGLTTEAIREYDEIVCRFGQDELPDLAKWVGYALLGKSNLMGQNEMWAEAVSGHDEILERYGQSENPILIAMVDAALVFKGGTLAFMGRAAEGVDLITGALKRQIEGQRGFMGVETLLTLSNVMWMEGDIDRALYPLDFAIKLCDEMEEPRSSQLKASSLVQKGAVLSELGRGISEDEVRSLLECIGGISELPSGTVDVLIKFCASIGAEHALALIQSSTSTPELTLPLATALQLELGEHPRVAKEVEEVAKDIRESLRKLAQEPNRNVSLKEGWL